MKKVMILSLGLFIWGITCTAYGATFTKDYDYSGTFLGETYIQVNTDFANPSNPVGVLDPLIITSTDFTGFNTSDGDLFWIEVWQWGNLNTPAHEKWGLYFDGDTTDSTPASLIQLFSTSAGQETNPWVLDTMPGSFDLSGSNWAFMVDDYSSVAWHAGIKIDDVIISNVPIPAAVWLFASGLLGLIGLRRKQKS